MSKNLWHLPQSKAVSRKSWTWLSSLAPQKSAWLCRGEGRERQKSFCLAVRNPVIFSISVRCLSVQNLMEQREAFFPTFTPVWFSLLHWCTPGRTALNKLMQEQEHLAGQWLTWVHQLENASAWGKYRAFSVPFGVHFQWPFGEINSRMT